MKHADGTYKFTLKSYIKLKLLILDDWGLQEFNGKSLAILNEIISDRFENGSIIIANNRPFKSWSELFKERVIASALLV
ncbi:MAG TPA: ATP-binding protein [bacterium]|nr:ATP-binding protein [bacterium]